MVEISGGEKLTALLAEISKNANKAASVEVGFLEGATYQDGTSVPLVAAIQEFGAPSRGIPPRPFFRNMIAAKSDEWPVAVAALLKEKNYDAEKTLNKIGAVIAGQLRESIINTTGPALSPVTVMLRGMRKQKRFKDKGFWELMAEARARVAAGKTTYGASTKPLVDSGNLLKSIDHVVK
jgi:hypothetical protein